jgi:hypothetical protein
MSISAANAAKKAGFQKRLAEVASLVALGVVNGSGVMVVGLGVVLGFDVVVISTGVTRAVDIRFDVLLIRPPVPIAFTAKKYRDIASSVTRKTL